MTRARRIADVTWWVAIGMNAVGLGLDLATRQYHLAGLMACVVFGLAVARHLLDQSDRRLAARLSRHESEASRADYEQQTARYVFEQVSRGTAQILVERQRPH